MPSCADADGSATPAPPLPLGSLLRPKPRHAWSVVPPRHASEPQQPGPPEALAEHGTLCPVLLPHCRPGRLEPRACRPPLFTTPHPSRTVRTACAIALAPPHIQSPQWRPPGPRYQLLRPKACVRAARGGCHASKAAAWSAMFARKLTYQLLFFSIFLICQHCTLVCTACCRRNAPVATHMSLCEPTPPGGLQLQNAAVCVLGGG